MPLILFCLILNPGISAASTSAVPSVPPGNRRDFSARVTPEIQRRFEKALRRLQADAPLRAEIQRVAPLYGVSPLLVSTIIVTERTFMDFTDTLQSLAVRRAGRELHFAREGMTLSEFVQGPHCARCRQAVSSADRWDCIADAWARQGEGTLQSAFFNQLEIGYTFGIGQISALRALMLTDLVQRYGGLEALDETDAPRVYRHLLEPTKAIHYIAANLRLGLDHYRSAGVDISTNPGISATLYNMGGEKKRARDLARRNSRGSLVWPEENFYGWFVNATSARLGNSGIARP